MDWIEENEEADRRRRAAQRQEDMLENPPWHAKLVSGAGATLILGGCVLIVLAVIVKIFLWLLGI